MRMTVINLLFSLAEAMIERSSTLVLDTIAKKYTNLRILRKKRRAETELSQ